MAENSFLLQEVIDELLKVDLTLTSPLFKLKYLALLIKNDELLSYVTKEVEGYDYKADIIPDYRKKRATLNVDIESNFKTDTVEVPILMLEKEFHSSFEYLKITESIGVLEQMKMEFSNDTKGGQYIIKPLPILLLPSIQKAVSKIYIGDPYLSSKSARLLANKNVVIEILNIVRSRLIKFCMELAEKFGFDIKINSFRNKEIENNQIVYNLIRNEIRNIGNGNVTNTGDNSALDNKLDILTNL